MFERFTEPARRVVVLAQDEARALSHDYIGTEHILLALLREQDGVAARVLASFEVGIDEARAQVARTIRQGDELVGGPIPFTPPSKRVLALSAHEALALGDGYIGSEHLLLGLARENDGVAIRLLQRAGADASKIRAEVFRDLNITPPDDYESKMARARRTTTAP